MTRTATNRSKRRLVGAVLCAGLVGSGCAGHASSTATASIPVDGTQASESTTTSASTTTTTRPPTTTVALPRRLDVDGGVTLVVPARLDLRVAGTSLARNDDPNLRGTIVEVASTEGTYLSESFEISFPRRDQPLVPTFSSFRVAYFDPAAERWVALPTTIGVDRLTATATIASSYALLHWNPTPTRPSRRWPLPNRGTPVDVAPPNCEGQPPPWLRNFFTFATPTTLLKACVESIPGGVRVRVANNTTLPLPIVFDTDATSITFTAVPERARAIHPYLEARSTSRTVLAGPGVEFAADFSVAAEIDGAITARVDNDPAFWPLLYLFEILDLAAPGRSDSLQAFASTGMTNGQTLVDAIARCILDEPVTQPTWELGNPFPYVRKMVDCVVGRIEAAITATVDSRSTERALRDLSTTNPANARALGLAFALRNMLRGIDTVSFYWDIIGAQPDSAGADLALTWGPRPQTTRIVENRPSLLFGVPLGVEAEQAITALTRVLRQPTSEWEWSKGCELGGPAPMIRILRWGALQVSFTRYASGDVFDGWSYQMRSDYGPAVGGPAPDRFVFPNGVEFGMAMGQVADALGGRLTYWDVFQHLSVYDDAGDVYGRKQYFGVGADSPETNFTGYAEPGIAYCE